MKFSFVFKLSCFTLLLGLGSAVFSQSPAYPMSTTITGISFDQSTKRTFASGSDNWPVTWADDDHQYTSWGDGGGFGGSRVSNGVARIEGGRSDYVGINVNGNNPGISAEWGCSDCGKSYGIICINSILYLWVGIQDASAGGSVYGTQKLYVSNDHGCNWKTTGVSFNEGFFCPTILNFGKNYAGSRDDYVYHYAPEQKTSNWDVNKPGEIILMRVQKDSIAKEDAYEFFTGLDGSGNPEWNLSAAARQPVFEDPVNGVMRASVSYNAPLGRYLLTTQQMSRFQKDGFHIGIYEAPEPWGPWSTVYLENAASAGLISNGYWKTVFFNFSNKWLSADGKNFVLAYTDEDNWATMEGSFTVKNPCKTVPEAVKNVSAISAGQKKIRLGCRSGRTMQYQRVQNF